MAIDGINLLLLCCCAAFTAGFVDAIAGGGGLIQTPMGLVLLPQLPVSTVIGTLKIPAFSGTSFAAYQYLKNVNLNIRLLMLMLVLSLSAAFVGSALLTTVSNDFMKPFLLIVLLLLFIYTFIKKDFGNHTAKVLSPARQIYYACLISMVIGFYDGFVGPGAGSFLVLAFIVLLGFDFLHASAHAKLVNLATNLGSICLFLVKGKIIWAIALPMAASNAVGGWMGSRMAISKGNEFIRIFFLLVVAGTLIRFGYDVLMNR